MPRTGENIYKRKDGRWEGRYIKGREKGKTKYGAVYAKSYREVKEKLNEARRAFAQKTITSVKELKVADIGAQWLSETAVSLKQSSVNKYEDILRCYILPEFGEMKLSEITSQQIDGFANRLLLCGGKKKQGLTSATVAEVLSALNRIRVYAMKKNYPVAFSTECVSIKKEIVDIRVLSLEEEEQLIKHLQDHMDTCSLGILLCLFTGIRLGEVCAMKWDDISLSEKKMSICRTMQRQRIHNAHTGRKTEVRLLEPKSACSVRVIPLPDVVMKLLTRFYTPGAFLLTGSPSHFIEPRTMQNHFKKAIASCGIQDANFHALRHTFATRCIEVGFDVKSLSEILGHSSVAITMNRYVHPTMALKRKNMNRFSELFTVK